MNQVSELHSGECISKGRSLWRAQDGNKAEGKNMPFLPVADHFEAERWNAQRFGIYWTVNELKGDRKEESLVRILSWAVDFDEGTKVEQQERIRRFGLMPSLVVESARGYHVYYDAVDATKANYNKILTAMCSLLGADQGAKGVNRILRVPFYHHWKDPQNPFPVRIADMNDISYTEAEMLKFLVKEEEAAKPKARFHQAVQNAVRIGTTSGDFFDRVSRINCQQALRVLSGTEAVNFETYRFRNQGNGKTSVFVNDKSSNVWIDASGRIGSCEKGGPTIYQWLKWFGHDHARIKGYLEQYFPSEFT